MASLALLGSGAGVPAAAAVFNADTFRTPPNEFRSVPFYALNDELDPAELDRQLRTFQAGGFGGSFLHSRIGLLTEYLGEDWFRAMAAGVKTSQEIGIDAWFYDEDKWPSGFAGGIVPRQDPAFRARCLQRVPGGTAVSAPDTVLYDDGQFRYVCRVAPLGDAWFNGTSWVDLMNPDMVKAFIDCSYAPYVRKYGGQPRVRGIFTDEPQISPRPMSADKVSFSPLVPDAFRARTGRDLAPLLPSLFAEVGDWRRVRLNYYRTLADCFERAFSKQIGDYCAAHGFIWTGHYKGEDSPRGNAVNTGNLMLQLRHMQMPGIDALGMQLGGIYLGKVMTSVANQYDRPRRLSELFGISGHNMTFEDRMWITAWHTLMGINFMCPHLSLYSMKGERKRDYPPTISPHQPYWRYNRLFEDYSARLCLFATAGRTVPEVCVLNPIESDFIELASGRADARDRALLALMGSLLRTHRNFDLGDEQIIADVGRVEANRFVVGAMAYRAVVLPPLLTIRPSTLELLERFAAAGGPVLVAGSWPELVEGAPQPEALARLRKVATLVTSDDWTAVLNTSIPPAFTVEGDQADQVWTHLRADGKSHRIQLSNTSRLDTRSLALRVSGATAAALWNPVDGRRLRLRPGADGAFALTFAPAQTWIVSYGSDDDATGGNGDYAVPAPRHAVATLGGTWRGRRVDPNALLLDFARYSKDGGASWSEPEPVLGIYERFKHSVPFSGELRLKFTATVEALPATCRLVVEQPEMYRTITVNGKPVSFTNSGEYICFSFRTADVRGLLRVGSNEIEMALDFVRPLPTSAVASVRSGTEIENIYLVGDFGVKAVMADQPLKTTYRNQKGDLGQKPIHSFKQFALVREGDAFSGDLVTQGYPFYAGEFVLECAFDLAAVEAGRTHRLRFPGFEAVVIHTEVNGRACPPLVASPWETDVTAALQPGRNTVRVRLTNSLRNLLGPHHHKGGEMTSVGPATYLCNGDWPNAEKGEADWYDARLAGRAKLWRDDYFLIPFGLLQAPVLDSSPASPLEIQVPSSSQRP